MTTITPVRIPSGIDLLDGDLALPDDARGLVLFAHGSGSSRFSPRNRQVAELLWGHRLGTLLLDLLTPAEEEEDRRTRALRFDIERLAERLVDAIDWAHATPATAPLPIGLFGASTGAAAALVAAARRPDLVGAVVSRGGRPDLAGAHLGAVQAPVLLLVGGYDPAVLDLNRQPARALHAPHDLVIIPHATHLFEEPGALEQVAASAAEWFTRHPGPQPVGGAT